MKTRLIIVACATALLACATAQAVPIPALRTNGVQMSTNAATPVQSTKAGIWVDTSGPPNRLRFDDGSTSNYVLTSSLASTATLQAIYNNGGTGPQQIQLDTTRNGIVILNNATPQVPTFAVQNSAGTISYLTVDGTNGIQNTGPFNIGTSPTFGLVLNNTSAATSGAGNQQWSPGARLSGQQWNGAASVAVDWMTQLRPLTGLTTAGEYVWFNRYNGGGWTEMLRIDPAGNLVWPTNNLSIYNSEAGGTGFLVQTGAVYTRVSNVTVTAHGTTTFLPQTDNQVVNGSSSQGWKSTTSYNYYGKAQAPAVSTNMAIAPASGEQITLNLGATAIGSWTIASGQANEPLQLCFAQDGSGSRTIGTPPANIIWQGTTYFGTTHSAPVLTTTASKTDCFFLTYNTVLAKWVEVTRTMAN